MRWGQAGHASANRLLLQKLSGRDEIVPSSSRALRMHAVMMPHKHVTLILVHVGVLTGHCGWVGEDGGRAQNIRVTIAIRNDV
jgi:hypothetical protein